MIAELLAASTPLAGLSASYAFRAGRFALSASLRASWRDQRRVEWLMRDLESPCARVGHDYIGGHACWWCGLPQGFLWTGEPVSIHKPVGRSFIVHDPDGEKWWVDGDFVIDHVPENPHWVSRPVSVQAGARLFPAGTDPRATDEYSLKRSKVVTPRQDDAGNWVAELV